MKKILIHTCCGPCFVGIHDDIVEEHEIFKDKDVDITSFYFNPNIHPKFEYERRKETLIEYCKMVNCKLEIVEGYDLHKFVSDSVNLDKKYSCRCEYCYTTRLKRAFEFAKENGFDAVMTTLSISPYQNQPLIKKVGERLSKEYGIEFIHLDYTVIFRKGQNKARELGLYRQKYCGCIFSMDSGKWVY